MMRDWLAKLNRSDLLFGFWLRSFFIQLPWIICVALLGWFVMSSQGISLTEYAVEHPWIRYVCLGAVLASGWLVVTAADAVRVESVRVAAGQPPKFSLLWLFYWVTAFVLLLSRFSLTNEVGALGHFLGIVLTAATAVILTWFLVRFVNPNDMSAKAITYAIFLLLLPLLFLAAGAYLVTHQMEWVVGLGAFAVVGIGLILLAASIQSLFVVLPWYTNMPIICVSLFVGLALLLHGCQEPIVERPNPLLNAPDIVTRMDTPCGHLVGADQPAPAASDVKPTPLFLISSEGGGIRAAYWTAVSLEELSQSGSRPLLERTALLSGVSGGSLGLATWLAAQELPPGARLACIREFLSGDFFTPLVAGLLFVDIPRLFIPKSLLDEHRGDYFEAYIARRWRALTGNDFFYRRVRDLRPPKSNAKVYFNATDAISGQFVSFGNAAAPLAPGADVATASRLNESLREHLADLRVGQAVHMSARFPYLSPNPDVMLPARDAARVLFNRDNVTDTNPTRVASLVDGGYFDNSGLGPALRLIEDQAGSKDESAKSTPRFVIHIFNDQRRTCNATPAHSGCVRASDESLKGLDGFGSWGWLTRPGGAILAVRDQHSLQRLNELNVAMTNLSIAKPLLWSLPMPEVKPNYLLELIAHLPFHGRDLTWSEVALGWTLSPVEREFMDEQARAIRSAPVPKG